jgi:hypothetical protein
MNRGQKVKVMEYGGRELVRRVVLDRGASVVVCNEKEYTTARAEGREPDGIGFPRDAVEEVIEKRAVEA